jgi:hypothetical protein
VTNTEEIKDLREAMASISSDVQSAKGMMKASLVIGGIAQGIFVPAIIFLFSSTLSLREANVATQLRLGYVEEKCAESVSLSSTAPRPRTEAQKHWKDSSRSTRPAVSEQSATTTSLSLLDCGW